MESLIMKENLQQKSLLMSKIFLILEKKLKRKNTKISIW